MDLKLLPRSVRAELRGLPTELAEIVGSHLVAAGLLVDSDPMLAYEHAEAARRRAARLPVVREACAESAYAAGEYAAALSEYRALRRMSGDHSFLPIMADCERALGRPEDALELVREAFKRKLDRTSLVEARLVEAGARQDLGQQAEAMRLIKVGIEEFIDAPAIPQARLRVAYATMLAEKGDREGQRRWLETAAKLDPHDESAAVTLLAELDGYSLEVDEDEETVIDSQNSSLDQKEQLDLAETVIHDRDDHMSDDRPAQAQTQAEAEDRNNCDDDQQKADYQNEDCDQQQLDPAPVPVGLGEQEHSGEAELRVKIQEPTAENRFLQSEEKAQDTLAVQASEQPSKTAKDLPAEELTVVDTEIATAAANGQEVIAQQTAVDQEESGNSAPPPFDPWKPTDQRAKEN